MRQNESVDADDRAVHVDERASAVAGVDGSVGLKISERLGRIGLAGQRADYTHGDGILQSFGAADGEDELTDAGSLLADERERGEIGLVNFEQSEIGVFVLADEFGFEDAALADWHLSGGVAHGQGQGDANALCAFDDVGVGHDISVRVNDHAGADGMLADDERGLGAVISALALAEGTESGDENLNDSRGNFGGEGFEGAVELDQYGRGFGGLRVGGGRTDFL